MSMTDDLIASDERASVQSENNAEWSSARNRELDMRPTGWFQVAWSWDVSAGEVKPLRYFGQDLVLFRDLQGVPHILDAYCQHLGANLAFGGCVVSEGIACPFHGWVWGPDGRNVSIPYQNRPNKGRRVRAWHLRERNECIYLWHDVHGREPFWELPEPSILGEHVATAEFHPAYPLGRSHFTNMRFHPQLVVENAVDPHHFPAVHRTSLSPRVLERYASGTTWFSRLGFGRRWTSDDYDPAQTLNTLVIAWSGVGVSLNAEQLAEGIRLISIAPTPVDEHTSEVFATYWVQRTDADSVAGHYERRLEEAQAALPDDVAIWDHQRYIDPPGLATSEGADFRNVRRWARQFYPSDAAHGSH